MKYLSTKQNDTFIGKPKFKTDITTSIELEVSEDFSPMIEEYLEEHDFINTEDSSVISEWKSPIYYSQKDLIRILKQIDTHMQQGDKNWESTFFNDTTGCHISCGFDGLDMSVIRDYYVELFTPLSQWLWRNRLACKTLYNRIDSIYAKVRYTLEPDDIEDKYMFINVLHDTHIEFRLPKIGKMRNFYNTLELMHETMELIRTFFLLIGNNQEKNRLYAKEIGYRIEELHDLYYLNSLAATENVTFLDTKQVVG